jgi:O-antigen ligase
MARSTKKPVAPLPPASPWPARLSWLALGLGLALVLARGTMQEFLRDPFEVTPGSEPVPRAAGPATSIGLDLLCCVPALLVLLRRAIDGGFQLRRARSFVPLALLSAWMLLSTAWAADKFAALVTAFHWLAAMAILWAAAQLVRDWVKLRVAAAVLFSLLAVYAIQGLNYRLIEGPQTLETWQKNREKMLSEHGFVEGSFAARQFEEKLKLMESFGFFSSPNTFGAAISLLLVIGVGLLAQRLAEREAIQWAVPAIIVPLVAGFAVMALTRSRGAFVTLLLCLALFAARGYLVRHARRAFVVGLVGVIGAMALVIGYGTLRGRLPTSTLTFRWQYWVASAGMIRAHPWLGTGWSNFSFGYLPYRLPSAPEEIKDPHDLLVRFVSELGIIGGALLVVWLVLLWRELTQPSAPPITIVSEKQPGVLKFAAAVVAGATVTFLIAGVDWERDRVENFLLLRLLFLGVTILAASLAALRTPHTQEPDDRPAPWILYGLVLAAGGMLIHNLIDFSMFETGPMLLLAMTIGTALGARSSDPSFSGGPEGRASSSLGGRSLPLLIASPLWLAALLLVWGPISSAEQKAAQADEARRAGQFPLAERALLEANDAAWHLNADYAYRAARAAAQSSPPQHWQPLMELAILENPKDGAGWRGDAAAELLKLQPDGARVRRDYDAAVRLDPNNVQLRLEYAAILAEKLHDDTAALAQYEAALRYNDLLNADEKKRLSAEELEKVREKMRAMQGT